MFLHCTYILKTPASFFFAWEEHPDVLGGEPHLLWAVSISFQRHMTHGWSCSDFPCCWYSMDPSSGSRWTRIGADVKASLSHWKVLAALGARTETWACLWGEMWARLLGDCSCCFSPGTGWKSDGMRNSWYSLSFSNTSPTWWWCLVWF